MAFYQSESRIFPKIIRTQRPRFIHEEDAPDIVVSSGNDDLGGPSLCHLVPYQSSSLLSRRERA